MLEGMLDGRAASGWLAGGAPTIALMSVIVGAAVLAILLSLLGRHRRIAARGCFVLACGSIVLLLAALTAGGFAMHHVILTYPFPHLVFATGLALACGSLPRHHSQSHIPHSLMLGVAAVVVIINVNNVVTITRGLQQLGGFGTWSDAIYRLYDHLALQPNRPVASLDWGIHYNLAALAQGRLPSQEIFWTLLDPGAPAKALSTALSNPDFRYVLHAPDVTGFPMARRRFFLEVEAAKQRARLLDRVSDRSGRTVFEVYEVVPGGDLGKTHVVIEANQH
jgi:hypothetical protein